MGKFSSFLLKCGFEVYGIDISHYAARMSKQVQGSATHLPFRSKNFQGIVSIALIEHLRPEYVLCFLKECYRVLEDFGIFFLTTPNSLSLGRLVLRGRWIGTEDPTHINLLTTSALKKLVAQAGFSGIQMLHKLPILMNIEWTMPYYGLDRLFKRCRQLQFLLMLLMISTPLAYLSDTIWLVAKK